MAFESFHNAAQGDLTWANSAAAGTEVVSAAAEAPDADEGRAVLLIANPSTVTALTVRVEVGFDHGGGIVWHELVTIAVAANTRTADLIEGAVADGAQVRLRATNDTALGAADGFTASYAIRKLGR